MCIRDRLGQPALQLGQQLGQTFRGGPLKPVQAESPGRCAGGFQLGQQNPAFAGDSLAKLSQGPSGLLATAPPWSKPVWEATAKQLVWPSGARAYVLTPEAPGNIRGVDYHLSWLSEIQSWPAATREEAFSNFMLTTRLGVGSTLSLIHISEPTRPY